MQPEPFGQLAAYFRIAELDVAVGDGLSVIADPVVDQMTMGMGLVEVPNQKVLRIGDAHLLHVLPGNLCQPLVGELWGILR